MKLSNHNPQMHFEKYLLNRRKSFGFTMHSLQRLDVHMHNPRYHLVKRSDMFRANPSLRADLIDEPGNESDDRSSSFARILVFESGFRVDTVAFRHTRPAQGQSPLIAFDTALNAPISKHDAEILPICNANGSPFVFDCVSIHFTRTIANIQRNQQVHHTISVMYRLAVQRWLFVRDHFFLSFYNWHKAMRRFV